jgi:hypothetical protein
MAFYAPSGSFRAFAPLVVARRFDGAGCPAVNGRPGLYNVDLSCRQKVLACKFPFPRLCVRQFSGKISSAFTFKGDFIFMAGHTVLQIQFDGGWILNAAIYRLVIQNSKRRN